MTCKFSGRECDGCMRCHEDGFALGLEQCGRCREWREVEDLFSGSCAACLLDDEDFKAKAYLYIEAAGLEEDFYCGYVCGMDIGAAPERVGIEKHKFWQFYEAYAPFQDILRQYADDDLHHYAKWAAGPQITQIQVQRYINYFKQFKEAA